MGSSARKPSALDALIDEAQEAERGARRDHARAIYETAFQQLSHFLEVALAIDITRWIGRTYAGDGDLDAAMDCAELSLAIAEANGNTSGIAHALNFMGTLFQHRGEMESAVRHYDSARSHAEQIRDPKLLALIEQNLGIVANIQGNLSSALKHYQASLSGHRAAHLAEYAGYVLNNLGMVYTDLGRWDEAEQSYVEALESCRECGNVTAQIMVEVNRAEMWIERNRLVEAKHSCDTAKELIQRTGDNRALGEMHKHYGVIFREMGRLRPAEEHLGRAVEIAAATEDLLLSAEAAREQAELFHRQRRSQETLQSLNRAHQLFSRLRARRDLRDVAGKLRQLEEAFLDIVRQWGESIESADQYTQGHCIRVADYACALARAAGLEEEVILWFRMGALLHDVGKIVVPPGILNKPGKLTPEERVLVERHPDAGVDLLAEIEFPWDIRPMVRYHHERWCGGGYPTGISGEEIPLAARILCIADVYDALTSARPYRAALSPTCSLGLMTGKMAGHFDPGLLSLWEQLCTHPPQEESVPGVALAHANWSRFQIKSRFSRV